MIEAVPTLYTARFFCYELLSGGGVVPVAISYEPPIVELPYRLEHHIDLLAPEKHMLRGSLAEWRPFCHQFWAYLDEVGVERIAAELTAISRQHAEFPLCLLDWEDLTRGHRSHRTIFARWWEEKVGQEVLELLDDGTTLHYSQLNRQARPKRPNAHDPRWTEDLVFEWPLTHQQVTRWLAGRHWQTARSTKNVHSYTNKAWGNQRSFELIVLHLREHGEQELFLRQEYTYYVADYLGARYKHWTMGDGLAATVILNRKEIGRDGSEEPFGHPKRAPRAQPTLSIHEKKEEEA